MTEKQLQRLWWWRNDKSWAKIAKSDPGYQGQAVPSEVVKLEYERAAFIYEVKARDLQSKKPAWAMKLPFCDLSNRDLLDCKKRYPSQAWRNAGAIGSRRPGVKLARGELSLDGMIVSPGKTTPGLFQKAILERIERMMHDQSQKWGVKEYSRKKPWPWTTLENADRLANGVLRVKQHKEERDPDQSARRLLRDYSNA